MQKTPLKLVLLGTGGTIAGLAIEPTNSADYVAAQLGVADLLVSLPANLPYTLVTEQVAQIDSKDMDAVTWLRLAARCRYWLAQEDVQAIVITHGTDTLEETAYFLHALLSPRKAVVLTCAMQPANAVAPDGPQNLRDAITVAVHPLTCGVVAVCAGIVHSARDVQKVHAWRLDPFSSADAGPLAVVEAGVMRLVRPVKEWLTPDGQAALLNLPQLPASLNWPRVEIVWSYADAHPGLVQALVAQGVQGLVVAGTGNGRIHHALLPALRQAQAAGVRVVVTTRCVNPQLLRPPGALLEFTDAGNLSPAKARIALAIELLATHV